jgi:hypothetical protein
VLHYYVRHPLLSKSMSVTRVVDVTSVVVMLLPSVLFFVDHAVADCCAKIVFAAVAGVCSCMADVLMQQRCLTMMLTKRACVTSSFVVSTFMCVVVFSRNLLREGSFLFVCDCSHLFEFFRRIVPIGLVKWGLF